MATSTTTESSSSDIPKMQYVRLGKTGLKVSRICLGCMSFGTPEWYPWAVDEEKSFPVIKRAIELGINFFDTANIYSNGLSEEILGRALKQLKIPREEVVIATKVFGQISKNMSENIIYAKTPNQGGLSRKHIFDAVEASLKRLQVDYIDLYQIHRWDYQTPIEETMEALHDLVKAGKVRYIGASSMYAWQFAKANYVAKQNGWTQFVSMQDLYNLLYREEEREMIPLCQDLGVGLIPWSPLAMGQLVNRKESSNRGNVLSFMNNGRHEANIKADEQIIERARELAEKKGVSTPQVALAWLLSKSVVSAPIVGASRISTLEDSIKSISVTLAPEDVKFLEEPYLPRKVEGFF